MVRYEGCGRSKPLPYGLVALAFCVATLFGQSRTPVPTGCGMIGRMREDDILPYGSPYDLAWMREDNILPYEVAV